MPLDVWLWKACVEVDVDWVLEDCAAEDCCVVCARAVGCAVEDCAATDGAPVVDAAVEKVVEASPEPPSWVFDDCD